MSIRNKLILMLALPLAALALVGALGFRGQSTAAAEIAETLDEDTAIQSVNRVIKAIGGERIAMVEGAVGQDQVEARAVTDASYEDATAAINAANLANTEALFAGITQAAQDVSGARVQARVNGDQAAAVALFNSATMELRMVRDSIDVDYPTADSLAGATSIDLAVDIADRQDSAWLEYIAADRIPTFLADRLRSEITAGELLREQILEIAPEDHLVPLAASVGSESDSQLKRAGVLALDRSARGLTPLDDGETLKQVVSAHEDWFGHAVTLQEDVTATLRDAVEDAESRQNLFALLGTLGLLVMFGLIYVVYRSVVRPLDDLLEGAEHVASNRLPAVVSQLRTMGSSDENIRLEPLRSDTDDELGSLVQAFNDVQLTAFDLAVEQARSRRNIAEMFVNLGRRNQKLLQRMLGVISELEHDEKDPGKLEQLFQLDHMTTRMRRNAESLLVVAGTTTPRQWARPVPAEDVVRSALAEVQDYHRVDVLSLADAPMAGNAAADVTHLLAELLENSLQFSDPESRVSISARWKGETYRIVISDQGFGMDPSEIAENNRLIADPPPPDQAPTRFLGLFVVGHLAKRHGIDVILTDASIGGTDARVAIPATLMSDTRQDEPQVLGLPVRNEVDELDLDAELAQLTAETEAQRLADDAFESSDDDAEFELPVRGKAAPAAADAFADDDALDALIAEDDVVDHMLTAETVRVEKLDQEQVIDFDVAPDLAAIDFDVAPDLATIDFDEAPDLAIDFDEAPELPTLSDAAPALDELPPPPAVPTLDAPPPPPLPVRNAPAPVMDAPAPLPTRGTDLFEAPSDLPVRGTAPAAPTTVAPSGGLPQRTPRATLDETGNLPASTASPDAEAELFEAEEDVTITASTVSSAFSAFQAGINRVENNSN